MERKRSRPRLSTSNVNAALAGTILGMSFWLGLLAWLAAWLAGWPVLRTVAIVEAIYIVFAASQVTRAHRRLRRAAEVSQENS